MEGGSVGEAAAAKINLALHVTGQRPDGYHTLHSLCVFTELADHLTLVPARSDELTITGPFAADLAAGRSNLVMRALERFRSRFPDALETGIHITLEKHLPVASGLGGGSADAAAALRGLRQMSAYAIHDADLFALASGLGADVPMCLMSRTCEVTGVGERVRPLAQLPTMHMVLVNPGEPLATPAVFRNLAERTNPPLPDIPERFERAAHLSLWLADTRNDLQPPAEEMVPAIRPILAAITRTPGCALARMSGSGATCFGLYGSEAAAHQAAHDLRDALPRCWVAATRLLED
ncbi:4-(cytidine 5'-diphospho)-2-C-methyl-D-erythritol kinase [Pelagibacterium montanilacus]|uniref:4-(cytidine 5'-diphospho)-2-C-methyl-D-erythritol kinase n=1 Tax=Pelagibacterium montanilacus TaxID=2185280 RepID=UPI000F8D094D|nr:4-(cytidine 5'-diphospho)-2-C-methyl-D-erythritol kinase [Pelagibacterium montanilacus]